MRRLSLSVGIFLFLGACVRARACVLHALLGACCAPLLHVARVLLQALEFELQHGGQVCARALLTFANGHVGAAIPNRCKEDAVLSTLRVRTNDIVVVVVVVVRLLLVLLPLLVCVLFRTPENDFCNQRSDQDIGFVSNGPCKH